jgi:RNA polymerase-binding transcription factor DksA
MAAHKSHIDAEQRERLRNMLIRLRAQTHEQIQQFRRDQEGESETAPGDEMDAARSTADVETHAGLIGRAEEKLKFLDDALTLLDEGKFGICGKCGEPSPTERLIAIPFALYCVNCQSKQAAIERRASEGGTIPPYDHLWSPPEEMADPGERNAPLDSGRRLEHPPRCIRTNPVRQEKNTAECRGKRTLRKEGSLAEHIGCVERLLLNYDQF